VTKTPPCLLLVNNVINNLINIHNYYLIVSKIIVWSHKKYTFVDLRLVLLVVIMFSLRTYWAAVNTLNSSMIVPFNVISYHHGDRLYQYEELLTYEGYHCQYNEYVVDFHWKPQGQDFAINVLIEKRNIDGISRDMFL
jgi:hypothetical protein